MISPFLNTIRTSDYIIVLIALFMFAFMPTSSAGIMFDTRSILIIWIFTFGYLIYLVVNNTRYLGQGEYLELVEEYPKPELPFLKESLLFFKVKEE